MRHLPTQVHLILCLGVLVGLSKCHKPAKSKVVKSEATCTIPTDLAGVPNSLLQGGCFAADGTPAANLHSYEVNAPLWADGGGKARWLVVAPGASDTFGTEGVLTMAAGNGVFKEFYEGNTRLETRLLFMDSSGTLQAVNWAWNDEQTDATLVSTGDSQTIDNVTWSFPGKAQCVFCHNAEAGYFLGARYSQINNSGDANGTSDDQIGTLVSAGVISGDIPTGLSTWIDPTGDGNLDLRARSYLAANCSFCHRPNGASGTSTDFRFDTDLADMGLCNVEATAGTFGVADARLLVPGDPNSSIISYRIHSIDAGSRMPPVGRTVEDVQAAGLIDDWIASIQSCP